MLKDTLTDLIENTARDLGYLVYQSSILLRGEHTHIVVRIDSLKGVSHDDCEVYSRELARRLDAAGDLSNYYLEISSPGINRKVRTIDEFVRFSGSPVKVKFNSGENKEVVKGTILAVEGDFVILKTDTGEMRIDFSMILDSNLDY